MFKYVNVHKIYEDYFCTMLLCKNILNYVLPRKCHSDVCMTEFNHDKQTISYSDST